METFRCRECKLTKPTHERVKNGCRGQCNICKPCRRPLTAAKTYAYNLKTLYGLTVEDYEAMNRKQGGLCLICGEQETTKTKDGVVHRLRVDHDHRTGRVRGLLCSRCNSGIGMFNDVTVVLERALQYLRTWKELPEDGSYGACL